PMRSDSKVMRHAGDRSYRDPSPFLLERFEGGTAIVSGARSRGAESVLRIFRLGTRIQPLPDSVQRTSMLRSHSLPSRCCCTEPLLPSKAPEPTPTAGTSAAKQPRVPASGVAHL